MVEINLNGAEFFAFHGYYPEEQLLGGRFLVDISVSFEPAADFAEDDIDNTVNYEQLYNIACDEMKINRKLIETVGQAIANTIKQKFPFINNTRISIQKIDPPLKGKVRYSSVVIVG
jgi:dihydroneopterin aldolase